MTSCRNRRNKSSPSDCVKWRHEQALQVCVPAPAPAPAPATATAMTMTMTMTMTIIATATSTTDVFDADADAFKFCRFVCAIFENVWMYASAHEGDTDRDIYRDIYRETMTGHSSRQMKNRTNVQIDGGTKNRKEGTHRTAGA